MKPCCVNKTSTTKPDSAASSDRFKLCQHVANEEPTRQSDGAMQWLSLKDSTPLVTLQGRGTSQARCDPLLLIVFLPRLCHSATAVRKCGH